MHVLITILTASSFVPGLLTGEVGITAKARLKNNFVREENENIEEDSKDTVIEKQRLLLNWLQMRED